MNNRIITFIFFLFLSIGSNALIAQGFNTLSFGASGVQHEDTLYFGDSIHVSFWLVNQGTTPIYDFVSILSYTYDINGTQIGWGTTLGGSLNYYNTDSSLTVGDSILINITASVTLFSYALGDNIIEIFPGMNGLGNVVDTSLTSIHILTSNTGGPIVYIPDANFKAHLISPWSGVNTNGDSEIQVSEATALNSGIHCPNYSISDLTGIEAFTALQSLDCSDNYLTSLDVSSNTALFDLFCNNNQLTSLVLNMQASEIHCQFNQLTNLDVSGVSSFSLLLCNDNQLTTLDASSIGSDPTQMVFSSLNNPNLTCINIDSTLVFSATMSLGSIDPQHYFSNNCPPTSIEEHTTNKELLKVTDLLGRETKGTKNEPLLYIYDDGTVEKRIVIE